jgi:hypothetical protein
MEIIPADRFTFEELTEAYNQTRIDYLVPMPMNVARLREYVHAYDVGCQLMRGHARSIRYLGLGMLGLRPAQSWITRLGVLPSVVVRASAKPFWTPLISRIKAAAMPTIWLEVIKGNEPAHQLFAKFGFIETSEN